jgi:hypothetical protein
MKILSQNLNFLWVIISDTRDREVVSGYSDLGSAFQGKGFVHWTYRCSGQWIDGLVSCLCGSPYMVPLRWSLMGFCLINGVRARHTKKL